MASDQMQPGVGYGAELVGLSVLAEGPFTGRPPSVATVRVPLERVRSGPLGARLDVRVRRPGQEEARPVSLSLDGALWGIDDVPPSEDLEALLADSRFLAQHVYGVASDTLQEFERTMGRRLSWASGHRLQIDAYAPVDFRETGYDPVSKAIRFGHRADPRAPRHVPMALYRDLVAHEVTHAILDGYRPRWADAKALLDGFALHEAIADLTAMLSVFSSAGRVEQMLSAAGPKAGRDIDEKILRSGLFGLADGLFSRGAVRRPLDRSVPLEWQLDPEPHARGEVVVQAVLNTVLSLWKQRLDYPGGRASRYQIAESGARVGQQVLRMVLRSLAYLPPVDPTWTDLLRAILASDLVMMPEDAPPRPAFGADGHAKGYRETLRDAFWDIDLSTDPDARLDGLDNLEGLRYPVRLSALASDPEEVNRFIWANPRLMRAMDLDEEAGVRVERVRPTVRVAPDGFVVSEICASFVQEVTLTRREARDRLGLRTEAEYITVRGGATLRFDEGGRLCFAALKPVMDAQRQRERAETAHAEREAGGGAPAGFHTSGEREDPAGS
ncbi:hypothetical protein GCM10012320_14410 [Sinomonas cellulolyticus]|jgi:hypothetical protein|uniref:Uncharacterized protein n=1 Tax=Sinomonas cellulolyticus TaxID=2801916 RepID=A0ABS1K029_9MICC|nr:MULTISPECIES: hypothetical protein [Sinomonas]MBL0704874.1 hypothetical protein [Sinomonas cellulolyticus]GHG47544.1 hypothetical protein GCM10012320_14410 [Sinomonas sp. KCTC 49339]